MAFNDGLGSVESSARGSFNGKDPPGNRRVLSPYVDQGIDIGGIVDGCGTANFHKADCATSFKVQIVQAHGQSGTICSTCIGNIDLITTPDLDSLGNTALRVR